MSAVLLELAADKGWIKLPDDSQVTQAITLVGAPLVIAVVLVIFLFPVKLLSIIEEEGLPYFLANVAILLGILIFCSVVGYSYFRYRKSSTKTVVQRIDLDAD